MSSPGVDAYQIKRPSGGGGLLSVVEAHGSGASQQWVVAGTVANRPQRNEVWAANYGAAQSAAPSVNVTAINAAIAEALTIDGIVVLPPGRLDIDARIAIPSGAHLLITSQGAGTEILPAPSVAGHWLQCDGNSRVTLEGVSATRATAGTNHIRVVSPFTSPVGEPGYLRLTDVNLHGSDIAVIVDSGGVSDQGEHVTSLESSLVQGTTASGVAVFSHVDSVGKTLRAHNSIFEACGSTIADHGIYAHPNVSLHIVGNRFMTSFGGYAVQHFGAGTTAPARSIIFDANVYDATVGLGYVLTSDHVDSVTSFVSERWTVRSAQPAVQARSTIAAAACSGIAANGGAIGFSIGNSGTGRSAITNFNWRIAATPTGTAGSAVSTANSARVSIDGGYWQLTPTTAGVYHHGVFASSGSFVTVNNLVFDCGTNAGGGAIPIRSNASVAGPNTDVSVSNSRFNGDVYGVYGTWCLVEGPNGARAQLLDCDMRGKSAGAAVYPLRSTPMTAHRLSSVRNCLLDTEYGLAPRTTVTTARIWFESTGRNPTSVASATQINVPLGYQSHEVTGAASVGRIAFSAGVGDQLNGIDQNRITLFSPGGFTLINDATPGSGITLAAPFTVAVGGAVELVHDNGQWRLIT